MGVGLWIEENLQEILSRFHTKVTSELNFEEPSLHMAAPVLLHDLARAARSTISPPEPWHRGVVLVLSQPQGGIRGLLQEFSLLRLSLWETISLRHHAFTGAERRQIDRYLDEAMAAAAERWAKMVRIIGPNALPNRTAKPLGI